MFNRYPYTNFHELNLDYFIQHFKEIFTEWEQLYDELQSWKTDTTAALAQWRAEVETDLDERETALRAELEIWKQDTADDISDWETATLNALDAWKTAATAQFEAIRVQAAASAEAAAASQTAAASAAAAALLSETAAEEAAAAIQASAAQIQQNADDIDELKTQLDSLENYVTNQDFNFVADYGFTKQLWKISNGDVVSDAYKYGYRVATPYADPIYLLQGTKIVLPNNRRLYYAYSVDKTSGSWTVTGWITGEKTFDAGYYVLMISSLDDTVAVTDITSFLDGVKVYNPSSGETITEQVANLQNTISPYNGKIIGMEAGGYSFDATTGWTKSSYGATARIRTKTGVRLESGTRIIPPSGFVLWVGFKFNENYYYQTDFSYADYICDLTTDYVFMIKTYNDAAYTDSVSNISEKLLVIPPSKVPSFSDVIYNNNLAKVPAFGKIKSVARIGYNISSPASPPQNSLNGFSRAYDYGYRIMLADVRWTSDGVPVALHDATINSVARNSDGSEISTAISIDSITLDEADAYDFGIIKGPRYTGTKIMRINDFLEWCILHDCKPFLEIKADGVSEISGKLDSLFAVIDKFNIGNYCLFGVDRSAVNSAVHTKYPKATLAISFSDGVPIASTFAYAKTLKDDNEVFMYVYAKQDFSYQITAEMVEAAVENGIGLGISEIGVSSYYNMNSFLQNKNNLAVDWAAIRGMPLSSYLQKGIT